MVPLLNSSALLHPKIDTLRPEVSLVYKAHLHGLFGLFFYAGLGLVSKANVDIKTCRMVAQFLAHKPVNSALLTDSFILSFSKLLKLWSWMQTRQTQIQLSGPRKVTGTSEKRAPGHGNFPAFYEHHPPACY